MSTGWGNDLPDYSGGDGTGRHEGDRALHGEESSGTRGIFAQDPSGQDPYAHGAAGPSFSGQNPYADGHHAPGPYAAGGGVQHPGGPVHGGPAGYGFAPPPPTSGAAIAGLVLGILGLTFCAGLTSPFGVFFSLRGMKEAEPSATPPASGRGLAIAGLVTSLVGLLFLLLWALWIVLMVIGFAAGQPS